MANNGTGLEGNLITHLEVAADEISEAIALIKDGKSLTAHEKIEIAFKRLLAAESLYKSKQSTYQEIRLDKQE